MVTKVPKPSRFIRLREKLGLTQAELAAKLGVSRKQVNKWERGHATPHPVFVEKLRDLEMLPSVKEAKAAR